jgi:hypothetical protein
LSLNAHKKGLTGEVRPEYYATATNSAISGTFGNCYGANGQYFPKILLKSGLYGQATGQNGR